VTRRGRTPSGRRTTIDFGAPESGSTRRVARPVAERLETRYFVSCSTERSASRAAASVAASIFSFGRQARRIASRLPHAARIVALSASAWRVAGRKSAPLFNSASPPSFSSNEAAAARGASKESVRTASSLVARATAKTIFSVRRPSPFIATRRPAPCSRGARNASAPSTEARSTAARAKASSMSNRSFGRAMASTTNSASKRATSPITSPTYVALASAAVGLKSGSLVGVSVLSRRNSA
jgi:hypothetical protein